MKIVLLFEALIFLTLLFFIVTQIAIPALNSEPLFPILRRRLKLENKLAAQKGKELEAKLFEELEKRVAQNNSSHVPPNKKIDV